MGTMISVGGENAEYTFEQRAKQLQHDNEYEQKQAAERNEEAKKSPFMRFYQVNIDNNNALIALGKKNPKALLILLWIFERMDNYNAFVAPYVVFEEKFDMSRATVARCIKLLKDEGYVYIHKAGTCNVYTTNPDLVWKSYGKNKKYCEFPANVMISLSEQEKQIDKNIEEHRFKQVSLKAAD